VDSTFDLFVELGASDEQCDFPVVYASGVNGTAGLTPHGLAADLQPLFESIVSEISPPQVQTLLKIPPHVSEAWSSQEEGQLFEWVWSLSTS
jgi:predicted membrane GTPase involved in stress response